MNEGILVLAVLFLFFAIGFYMGYRYGKTKGKDEFLKNANKITQEVSDRMEKRKQQEDKMNEWNKYKKKFKNFALSLIKEDGRYTEDETKKYIETLDEAFDLMEEFFKKVADAFMTIKVQKFIREYLKEKK